MTISMYKTSVPIFVQFLTRMSAVLDKAAAHCGAKKIEPATLLNMRLYPDMYPLVRQVRAVTDHAISGTARLSWPLSFTNFAFRIFQFAETTTSVSESPAVRPGGV